MGVVGVKQRESAVVPLGWWVKSFLGGVAWMTLMFSRFLVMLGEDGNRMCYFWTGWDSAVLFSFIGASSIFLALFWRVVTGTLGEAWIRVLRGGGVFLTSLGIIQLLPVQGADWLLWGALVAGVLLGLCATRDNDAVWEWTGIVLISLSPLYLVFIFQAFQWESFAGAGGKKAPDFQGLASTNNSPSVFLVLYDSVAAGDLYDETGEWKPSYPALAAFGKESLTFCGAESPGSNTDLSIPGIVLQRPMDPTEPVPWRYWRTVDQSDSWLLLAKHAGHVRTLIGEYIPWGKVLQEQADHMDVPAYHGWGKLTGKTGHALRDILVALDAVHAPWGRIWDAVPKVRWWAGMADTEYRHRGKQRQWEEFKKISLDGPAHGQTVLFHSTLTHDSDYLEDGTLAPTRGTPESELAYVDREFGEWVAEMKKRGRWDDCWVLLTADHSKGQGRRHRHVPFAVKAPGEIGGGTWVKGTMPLWQLTPFLKSVYDDNPPETSLSILTGLPEK